MEKLNIHQQINLKVETEETKVSRKDENKECEIGLDDSLHSSSVLLTPDASPVKDKETVTESNAGSDDDDVRSTLITKPVENDVIPKADHTYSLPSGTQDKCSSSTDSNSHCKQLGDVLERPTSTNSSQSSVPKKRRGRKGKAKPSGAAASEDKNTQPAKPKPSRRKKSEPEPPTRTITDYFPIRRSGRRPLSALKKEETEELEKKILTQCDEGLKVVDIDEKGRGVIATRQFQKGEFVIEYAGDLIDLDSAKEKEQFYAENPKFGCYMYYFIHKNQKYCVDATAESGKLGRLLNHSRNGNCHTKVVEIKKTPYLILVASRNIQNGEELLYDYGDRSKSSIESHPWLKL